MNLLWTDGMFSKSSSYNPLGTHRCSSISEPQYMLCGRRYFDLNHRIELQDPIVLENSLPRASFSSRMNFSHSFTPYGKVDVDEVMRSVLELAWRTRWKRVAYQFAHVKRHQWVCQCCRKTESWSASGNIRRESNRVLLEPFLRKGEFEKCPGFTEST